MVVVQDVRGRHASDGRVHAVRRRGRGRLRLGRVGGTASGSNGKVGMYGFSYPGATQLLAAALRNRRAWPRSPPASRPSQFYDGWTYDGRRLLPRVDVGLGELPRRRRGAARGDDEARTRHCSGALGAAPHLYWKLPLAGLSAAARRATRRTSPTGSSTRATTTTGARPRSTRTSRASPCRPSTRRLVRHLPRRARLRTSVGHPRPGASEAPYRARGSTRPGARSRPAPREDVGANAVDDWHLRFFDEVLKGRRGRGVLRRRRRACSSSTRAGAIWTAGLPSGSTTADWYPPLGRPRELRLRRRNPVAPTRPPPSRADVFLYDPLMPSTEPRGPLVLHRAIAPMGPADQEAYEASKGVLVYTTEPLERDLVLLGDASVDLFAVARARSTPTSPRGSASSTRRALDEPEGGHRPRPLPRLALRAALLEPGQVYRFSISLGPVGARVAGRRAHPARRLELRLPAVGSQPQHRRRRSAPSRRARRSSPRRPSSTMRHGLAAAVARRKELARDLRLAHARRRRSSRCSASRSTGTASRR